MSFGALIDPTYWLGFPPALSARANFVFVAAVGVLFFGGLLMTLLGAKMFVGWTGRVARRFAKVAVIWGFVAVVLFFFRVQAIPFFSLRLWLGLWVIGFVAHLVATVLHVARRLPALKEEAEKREAMEKYLPR